MSNTNLNKGVIIAGTNSGSGKTTLTLGLIATLEDLGYSVQPFKIGPDFIDPGIHNLASKRPSINLDRWMTSDDYVIKVYDYYSKGTSLAIIEGVMGLFDGGEASTASVARLLDLPIILVVNVSSMAESVGAIVYGFSRYDSSINVAGVILNRVASLKHLEMIKKSLENNYIKLLGYLPVEKDYSIKERHLGLTIAEEQPIDHEAIKTLKKRIEENIDLAMLLEIARPMLRTQSLSEFEDNELKKQKKPSLLNIAIAKDKAFCFYYRDVIDLLKKRGVNIITFSPLKDRTIPKETDFLYLGGGYPELNAKSLSQNRSMIASIRDYIEKGGIAYAECGGFMYLTKGIYDLEERYFPMVGIYPTCAKMQMKRAFLGYREVEIQHDCPIGKRGDIFRGHEFHYSYINPMPEDIKRVFIVNGKEDGYLYKNTLGSYIHLHLLSNPFGLERIFNYIEKVKIKNEG